MKVKFNWTPKQWQNEVIEAVKDSHGTGKRFVVVSGRQRGKTAMIIILLIMMSLKQKGVSVLVEPTIAQSMRVFEEIKDALEGTRLLKKANGSSLIITLLNGSEIWFRSTAQRDGLRGMTCSNILVLDEVAFMPDEMIQIVLPIVNVKKCPVLMCSTPMFASGYFYEMFGEGLSGNPTVQTFEWYLDKYDMSEFITDEQFNFYKRTYSKQQFQAEILGKFVKDKSFVFGDFTKCIRTPNNKIVEFMGIDWGTGQNGDSTVVTMMNADKEVVKIWETNNLPPTEQLKMIAMLINQENNLKSVLVELNSIGQVYYDSLLNLVDVNKRVLVEGFQTSNDSKREIIENIIQAFNKDEIGIIDDENLKRQLEHYQIEKTKTGYTYNAPRGFHDDYVMSLAICYNAANNTNLGGFWV